MSEDKRKPYCGMDEYGWVRLRVAMGGREMERGGDKELSKNKNINFRK